MSVCKTHSGSSKVSTTAEGVYAAGLLSFYHVWCCYRGTHCDRKQLIVKGHKRQSGSFRLSVYGLRSLHCVWEKKIMTAPRKKEHHQYFPTKQTLQLCQLGSRWLALWQRSHTHSEGVAVVKMWVVTFHHTCFYPFTWMCPQLPSK